MAMDIDFIARLLDLVERSKIAELDLTVGGERLRLVKHGGDGATADSAQAVARPAPEAPASLQPAAPRLHAVRAGFPGTFYRAPAPGEKPFVEPGDRVEDGTQIGILEAMKTMNPLEADIAGVIRRIALEDASPVETGDVIVEIEPLPGT